MRCSRVSQAASPPSALAIQRSPAKSVWLLVSSSGGAEPEEALRQDEQHVQAGQELAGGAEERHLLHRRHRNDGEQAEAQCRRYVGHEDRAGELLPGGARHFSRACRAARAASSRSSS